MSAVELDRVALDLLWLRRVIKRLEAQAQEAADKLKAEMVTRGTEELSGNGWEAKWVNVTVARLDTAALKRAAPEVAERFTKTTTTTRFTIA